LQKELAHGGLPKLAKRKGYGRYLKIEEKGKASINWRRVEQDARYDGKYVLRTATNLPPEQVAVAYKELWRVEHAFRDSDLFLTRTDLPSLAQKAFAAVGLRPPPKVQSLPA
jgi:hypothetical protein